LLSRKNLQEAAFGFNRSTAAMLAPNIHFFVLHCSVSQRRQGAFASERDR
jgi:hypothetical protein